MYVFTELTLMLLTSETRGHSCIVVIHLNNTVEKWCKTKIDVMASCYCFKVALLKPRRQRAVNIMRTMLLASVNIQNEASKLLYSLQMQTDVVRRTGLEVHMC